MEGKTIIAAVSSKGQITIPLMVRKNLHISGKGDIVGFQLVKEGALLKHLELTEPEEEFTKEEWRKLERLANQKGKVYTNPKEFLKEIRKL